MNLKNLLKPIAQSIVNSALPAVKSALEDLLNGAVAKDTRVPAELKLVFVSIITSALEGWTIKL
jgi:hypothetical protein